jgi:hypothetical protein
LRKRGYYKQKQRYQCKDCGVVFILEHNWAEKAFDEYCFHRVRYKEIGKKYDKCSRSVQRGFDRLRINRFLETQSDKYLNLVFDGTYFGWDLCYMLFRIKGKTIYFKQCAENIANISQCLKEIEALGYSFKSFTIDGRKGVAEYLKQTYGVPVQYCQFHQKKTIRRYLTKEPKTACGQAVKALVNKLCHLDRTAFHMQLLEIKEQYKDFLAERNENKQYMHRKARSAIRSLTVNELLLFTYKDFPELKIPNTTNSCEGTFSQLKKKVGAHPGLTRTRLKRVVDRLFYGNYKD